MKLTKTQLAYLRMFTPQTYSIKLGEVGKELEQRGLVKWVPSWMGSGNDYAITDAGRAALSSESK